MGGPAEAAEWFENERQVLLAVIGKAAESGHAPHAWELPWAAGWYFQDEACWQRLAAAQEAALAVAARMDDLAGLATANLHLGWLRFLLCDVASAGHYLDEAINLARQLGDMRLHALAGLRRAYVLHAQDRIPEAIVQARQALRLYRTIGDPRGEARALYTIGGHLIQLGDHQQAINLSSHALMVCRESFNGATASRIACKQ
jgi:tetratricopeptide (TPR) repeat protein